MSNFTAEVYQNPYLPPDGSEVHAVVTVTSAGEAGDDGRPDAAEVIIVDTSGSMSVPGSRISAARDATCVAIDCIRDGVVFAVVAGSDHGYIVYPSDERLVEASQATRDAAKQAVRVLKASGGTVLGSWLTVAGNLFARVPDHVCHAILLTDGEDQHETSEQLDAVLAACAGRFQCDCRGVGTDWEVSELRRIASALLGTVDIIPDPAEMAADFRAMIEVAMSRATRRVSLRLWTPQGAQVAFVRQVAPTIEDLTDRGIEHNALTADYPTGSWSRESRDFHICIKTVPRNIGDEMLAARVSLVEDEEVLAQGLVKAVWTDDEELSTTMNREVAHATGQRELYECVQDGLQARRDGDQATATFKLGRAVQLARQSDHENALKMLERIVEIDDPASGTVRLRRDVSAVDEMALDTRSTKTVRVPPQT